MKVKFNNEFKSTNYGLAPRSSGYRRRSMGREFESRNRILGGSFLKFTCLKIVLLFEQTESRLKRGSGRHNFLKSGRHNFLKSGRHNFLKSANHLNTLKCTKLGGMLLKMQH